MNEKPIKLKIDENSFELSLRILGNEFVAIKIGSTNFSGKLIAGGVLLLFFTLILLEGFPVTIHSAHLKLMAVDINIINLGSIFHFKNVSTLILTKFHSSRNPLTILT